MRERDTEMDIHLDSLSTAGFNCNLQQGAAACLAVIGNEVPLKRNSGRHGEK